MSLVLKGKLLTTLNTGRVSHFEFDSPCWVLIPSEWFTCHFNPVIPLHWQSHQKTNFKFSSKKIPFLRRIASFVLLINFSHVHKVRVEPMTCLSGERCHCATLQETLKTVKHNLWWQQQQLVKQFHHHFHSHKIETHLWFTWCFAKVYKTWKIVGQG